MGFSPFRPCGVTRNTANAYGGYTLFAQLATEEMLLMGMDGTIAHRWASPKPDWGFYTGELLENGNLLALISVAAERRPGGAGALVELDWEGRLVWYYENPGLHHHFTRLANGNTLAITWERLPADIGSRVLRVRDGDMPSKPGTEVLGDVLIEVNPSGETVWQWRIENVFVPEEDRTCYFHEFPEWTHCNSVAELANGDILVSFRLIDTIAIIEKATGKLRWKWGRGVLGHQHDASMLENGNILVFNNEWHRIGALDASALVEVSPTKNEVVWKFVPSPAASFYTGFLGGAQRLPNGNTLACEGSCARLFEVNQAGDLVWEYNHPVKPLTDSRLVPARRFGIVNARRYGPDHEALSRLRSSR
jgi:hypothetical protein